MSLLDDIYQDVILDHYRKPRRHGTLEGPGVVSQEGVNPSCGDELTLYLRAGSSGLDARFVGEGCAISQASASLMTSAISGRGADEAAALSAAFQRLVRGEEPGLDLGDLQALAGIAKLPARVKCAVLPWKTLDEALTRLGDGPG